MAWCGQAMQCLPWVGNDAYSRVSTKEDDGAAHAQLEQSTTWADNTTVRLDGTVSAVSAVDAVDASTGSALDVHCERVGHTLRAFPGWPALARELKLGG